MVPLNSLNYVAVVLILLLLINRLTNNFLFVFFKVKMSNGKKIMVRCWAIPELYFAVGKFDGDTIIYKSRHKITKRLRPSSDVQKQTIGKESIFYSNSLADYIYRSMGISFIDVDDEKNAVINPHMFKAIQGHDAVTVDHIITRVMMAPNLKSNFEKIVIIALILIGLFVIANLALNYQIHKMMLQLPEMLKSMTGVV